MQKMVSSDEYHEMGTLFAKCTGRFTAVSNLMAAAGKPAAAENMRGTANGWKVTVPISNQGSSDRERQVSHKPDV
jgi:hypothetical protein